MKGLDPEVWPDVASLLRSYSSKHSSVVVFSIKGYILNILGFLGHMVSVANNQLRSCSMKAALDDM